MRFFSLTLILTLSACDGKPKSTADQFCDDFTKWAQSGPRLQEEDITPQRTVHFVHSKGCYFPSRDNQNNFRQCVVLDWDCSNEARCEDAADKKFKQAIVIRRLYFPNEFRFFEDIAVCIGARKAIEPWGSDKEETAHSYSINLNSRKYDLNYEATEKIAKIKITYENYK